MQVFVTLWLFFGVVFGEGKSYNGGKGMMRCEE